MSILARTISEGGVRPQMISNDFTSPNDSTRIPILFLVIDKKAYHTGSLLM